MTRRGTGTARASNAPGSPQPGGADWNTEGYLKDARFVPQLGRAVLAWLAPRRGQRILDLGCGDGALTEEIAATGAQVVGIDASASQIEVALGRGLDARLADAARLDFRSEFDAVFSNAALHWMRDLGPVLGGAARALKPGGRFVGEMGGRGNIDSVIAAISAALKTRGIEAGPAMPWVFPGPDEFEAALAEAGFEVTRIEYFARPTDLDGAMTDWLEVFAPSFARLLPADERPRFYEDVVEHLEPHLFDAARGTWWVDYIRLRFEAVRP